MRPNTYCLLVSIALVAALLGCGSGNGQRTVNLSGHWDASLQKANGTTVFFFSTSLQEIGGSVLTGSNVSFNPASSCFQSQLTESGLVQLASSGYGYYSGISSEVMSLTLKGTASGGGTDTLKLLGTVNPDNTVSGTWTLTGVSTTCSGSGGFTMTKVG